MTKPRDRLKDCFYDMIKRSRRRLLSGDMCSVYWETFEQFKLWSLASGYQDTLVLCRNGDTGNYHPDNVRWDTVGNNTIEAHAEFFEFINPYGKLVKLYNLNDFCRDNNLSAGNMSEVNKGARISHKGWTQAVDSKPAIHVKWAVKKSSDPEWILIYSLGSFCKSQKLDRGCMSRVAKGTFTSHKGWNCKDLRGDDYG